MRNYIILNNNNSDEITGLLIQSLPPISKPKIRVNVEEIDGRDGDIITKLGYSAYDKEISIGLYGNYDVDQVIAYFNNNQSGQVTFSNEPDKYYNYEIVDQIDFERLIRYKTATVTLHCQPFKYSTTEEKIQIDATEVSGTGSNITLDNTENGASFTKFQINGDTSQTGTPTPTSPIPVNVVSGDNEVVVCGKNLLNLNNVSGINNGVTYSVNSNGELVLNGTLTSDRIEIPLGISIPLNGTYTYTKGVSKDGSIALKNSSYSNLFLVGGAVARNITETVNDSITQIVIYTTNGTIFNNIAIQLQIEKGSTSSTYTPYQGQSYPLYLGVENLLNPVGTNVSSNGITFVNNGNGTFTVNGTATDNVAIPLTNLTTYPITLNANETYSQTLYILSGDFGLSNKVSIVPAFKNGGGTITYNYFKSTKDDLVSTKTTTETMYAHTYNLYIGTGAVITNCTFKVQLEKGAKSNSYTPYGTTPIELCKIGTYQDYIYKDSGKWYLKKYIKKIVFNGTQAIGSVNTSSTNTTRVSYNGLANGAVGISSGGAIKCNKLVQNNNWSTDSEGIVYDAGNGALWFRINKATIGTTQNEVNTYLENNNLIAYFPLATPINTEITNDTLISQLNALENATTYLGQTNITSSGSDLNPLLDVETYAIDNPSFTITNSGNIYSKPIVTIYGLGTVGLYLNGKQILILNMGTTTSQITIDVAKLEAYNQETGALMNRNVTGDYSKLIFDVGENTITESGTLQGIEIQNYSRWV